MNIAEILKDCPKGIKLYSPIYGEVSYLYIDINSNYPIVTESDSDSTVSFTLDGRLDANYDGECMLFPSKENRDWSIFKAPEKEYEFKPFDRVLVRGFVSDTWSAGIFSHKEENEIFIAGYISCRQCIPYEGNEHLLGTKNNPT